VPPATRARGAAHKGRPPPSGGVPHRTFAQMGEFIVERGCALPPNFRCSLGVFRGKRLSGAVCGCRGKRRLGAIHPDTL